MPQTLDVRMARAAEARALRDPTQARYRSLLRARAALGALLCERSTPPDVDRTFAGALQLGDAASGAGEWRGGLGSIREFVYLSVGGASVEGEGHEFAPWGFAGGKPGSPAELRLVRRDGSVEVLPSKVPHMQILAGERFVCVGPAGGGYGNPLARTPERVRHDVADGLLSAEAARRDYRVALTSPGSVDEAETARLRAIR